MSSGKVPFEIMSFEVDKLYNKQIAVTDLAGIDAHCQLIEQFIIACGYSTEEYLYKLGFHPDEN